MKKAISILLISMTLSFNAQNCGLIVPTDTFFCKEGINFIKAYGAISYTWLVNFQLTITDSGYVHMSTLPGFFWQGPNTVTLIAHTPTCKTTTVYINAPVIDCTTGIREQQLNAQEAIYYDLQGNITRTKFPGQLLIWRRGRDWGKEIITE